ncbi:MAG TPA: hypothetical protein VK327_14675, partial [Candidatus Paceibacterota bacterium]|nr:hypothetical protein [Candidatus Paceibacterota bacterium]
MNELERMLLAEAAGNAKARLVLRTGTRADTGRWWKPSPVWLCVTNDEAIVLSVSRRRHLERIRIAECGTSSYNHATGELFLAPAESLRFRNLRMKPSDALRVLSLLT